MNLLILADDHTGACDAVSCFPGAHWPTRIYLDPAEWRPVDGVSAVSFACRSLPEEVTVRRIDNWFVAMGTDFAGRIVVKIDSTLAAGSGVFLRAIFEALRPARAILTPANPAQGRAIVDGSLTVRGKPMGIRMDEWVRRYVPAFQVDSPNGITERDLEETVRAAGPGTVLCGSAGLTAALCRIHRPAIPSPPEPLPQATEVIVFCGSRQEISMEQLSELRAANLTSVDIREVDRNNPELALKKWPANWLRNGRAAVVIGGDTAAALAGHFSIRCLKGLGELTAGVAVGLTESRGVLATKPGGFGSPTTLVQAVRTLKGMEGFGT